MSNPASQQLMQPNGERFTFESITAQKKGTLEQLFMRGAAPNLGDLAGWQYKGRNISFASLLMRIRKFIKGFFFSGPANDNPEEIDGYNLWAIQNGALDKPWEPSSPKRHGFYKVYRVKQSERDNKFPHAILLNYGLGNNPWYHPQRLLRDYIVQVYPDDPGLLIGNAYVALGSIRIFGGYFVMKRLRGPDNPF